MTVDYLGVKIFFKEVDATGEIWVARSLHSTIYAMSIDRAGFSLPVWSSYDRVVAFLRRARLVGPAYEPHAVPLRTFSTSWLSDQGKSIVELQINPDGSSDRVLVMSPAEFLATLEQP